MKSDVMAHNYTVGVVLEERFYQSKDGQLYSPSGFGDQFWNRYLVVFDSVVIIGRVTLVEDVDVTWTRITDCRVSIRGVSTYDGIMQLIGKILLINEQFRFAAKICDALIIRAPGVLACLSLQFLISDKFRKRPIAIELVGDPVDVFGSGVGGRFGYIYKIFFKYATKILCSKSDAVSYVTEYYLQRRYPADEFAKTIFCSSVELSLKDFDLQPRKYSHTLREGWIPKLFVAASLEAPYKGIDFLVQAIAFLVKSQVNVKLVIAGGGRLLERYERLSQELGVAENIIFLGRISRADVLLQMKVCDIYIQPSLTEGLPRAVIEACACGAPILASSVGGIPEILSSDDMFPAASSDLMASIILDRIQNPYKLENMSARNLLKAVDYDVSVLSARRESLYSFLRSISYIN